MAAPGRSPPVLARSVGAQRSLQHQLSGKRSETFPVGRGPEKFDSEPVFPHACFQLLQGDAPCSSGCSRPLVLPQSKPVHPGAGRRGWFGILTVLHVVQVQDHPRVPQRELKAGEKHHWSGRGK